MLNGIEDSLSDVASPDNKNDRDDEDNDAEDSLPAKVSDDDLPGWVITKITKTVQHGMRMFRQELMRLDEPTQAGWGDVADNFCERDLKCSRAQFWVPAVIKPQTHRVVITPAVTLLVEHIKCYDSVAG